MQCARPFLLDVDLPFMSVMRLITEHFALYSILIKIYRMNSVVLPLVVVPVVLFCHLLFLYISILVTV